MNCFIAAAVTELELTATLAFYDYVGYVALDRSNTKLLLLLLLLMMMIS